MRESFQSWWHKPVTHRMRIKAAFIGVFGGLWLLLLLRMFFGAMPVSFTVLGYWAFAGAVVGGYLAYKFPRPISIVLFPFSIFGIGSN